MSKSYTLNEAYATKHMFPVTDQRVINNVPNHQKQAAGLPRLPSNQSWREMDTPSETERTTVFSETEAPLSATMATRWQ